MFHQKGVAMGIDIQPGFTGIVTIVFVMWGCSDSAANSESSTDGSTEGSGSDSDNDTEHTTDPIDTDGTPSSDPVDSDAIESDTDLPVDLGPSCPALQAPVGNVITVSPSDAAQLQQIAAGASEGDTISLEDGTYSLNGSYLWISAPGVTLRSSSGNREAVILDGNYESTEIITVAASDVTVADLTITRPYTHAIHVMSTDEGDTLNTLIYNVHIIDPREQGIKINPHEAKIHFTDGGIVACSHIEMTEAGRPNVNPTSGGCYTGGVDGHYSKNWIVRDNLIEGFYCPNGLSEHAIHFWNGCKDTVVERNILRDNARGVGFGMSSEGETRVYGDASCSADAYVDHFGGIVRNNFIFASSADLFASASGFDCGICLWSACGAAAVHNTVVSLGDNFSSIEWRFAGSQDVRIANNIATHPIRERDGAVGEQEGNLTEASLDLFASGAAGDLHLAETANTAIDQGVSLESGLCDEDIDGDLRDSSPDVGADER
jgi:hypothetical protein